MNIDVVFDGERHTGERQREIDTLRAVNGMALVCKRYPDREFAIGAYAGENFFDYGRRPPGAAQIMFFQICYGHHVCTRKVARFWPALTMPPREQWTTSMTPSAGATTINSIFIASSTTILSPASTRWPGSTATCHTLAVIGERTASQPSGMPAGGAAGGSSGGSTNSGWPAAAHRSRSARKAAC